MSCVRLLVFALGLLAFGSGAWGKTLYVANNPGPGGTWGVGSNVNGGLTKAEPFLTLSYALGKMEGGDTLVIANGTYSGPENTIDPWVRQVPEGTAGGYTRIVAETDGAVVIDGQGQRQCIYLRGNDTVDGVTGNSGSQDYIEIKGVVCSNSIAFGIQMSYVNHVRIINCGAVDPADGNTSGIGINYSSMVLLEGCYAWGGGRYKISTYHANSVVIRNCVVRFDRADTGSGDPVGGYAIYSSGNVEVQNCIDIDGMARQYWINYNGVVGSFGAPTTSNTTNRGPIYFRNVIALNNNMRFASLDWNAYPADVYFENCIGWDIRPSTNTPLIQSQGNSSFNRCTFGEVVSESGLSGLAFYNGWKTGNQNIAKNTIFYRFSGGGLFFDVESLVGNNIYGLDAGQNIIVNGGGAAGTTSFDPKTGGLKYLPLIEAGSMLNTAGENGSRVGAVIKWMMGKPGTMWGDPGYNLLQDGANGQSVVPLWPFPNEEVIREAFRSYSYASGAVAGARGFCVDGQSLTKYIWEYLGNAMPIPSSPSNPAIR